MYRLLITSDEIREALSWTSLGDHIITAPLKTNNQTSEGDDSMYVLSVAGGMVMNDTPQNVADVLHQVIVEHRPDVLMLDNMNSRAVLRRSAGKMRHEDIKYLQIEGALFSPAPRKNEQRTVSKREKREETSEASGGGKVVLGVLVLALAVAIVGGLAATGNTRGNCDEER